MPRPDETWMWERARSLLDEADRLQRQFFQPSSPGSKGATWEPPVDVFETDRELWILVALPGVSASNLEIRLSGCELVVAGARTLPAALKRAALKRLEIPRGRFERRLALPTGVYELGTHEMIDGCLALQLLKDR